MTNIRNVDLNLLVAFEALYDDRNVTRAAERLALTQPTVSGMLARLRELFRDPLFVRTQHGVLPTPRADALSGPVKALLASAKALVTPEEFDPASVEMTVSISANDYMQHALIVPFMAALREQAPCISLAVLPAYISGLAEKLARGMADLAVTIPEFADASLPRRLLYTERYVCIARNDHPLKAKKLSLKGFCRYDHAIVSPTGGSFSGPTDDALAQHGLTRNVSVSVPSFQVLLEVIRGGDFLALVPQRLLLGRMDGLKLFEPPVLVPDFDVIACWHPRVEADAAQIWIRSVLDATAKNLLQSPLG